MSRNNQTGGPEADHYARFEALPPRFRALLRSANLDLKVGWVEDLINRFGPSKAEALVRHRLREMMRVTIIEHYGRDHPQLRERP